MNLDTTDIAELLPAEAADRLRALRLTRDDAGAIMRSLMDRVLDARATRQDAETRLRSLTKTVRPLPPDHPSVIAVQRIIDNANAELQRLANHEAITAGAFNHAGRLVTTIERWARDHVSAGRAFAPAPTIEPRLLENENVIDAIERNRREIRRLEADLHACRSAPIPAAEAKAAMREQVAALAARGRPYVEGLIEHGEPITFEALNMRASSVNVEDASDPRRDGTPRQASIPQRAAPPVIVAWSQLDALGLVAWLHQDALVKRLSAEIDAAADDGAALSIADRKKRETELLSEIAGTRRQIAALIRAAEAEGIAVEFDDDTPPETILGVVVIDAAPQPAGIDHADIVANARRASEAAESGLTVPGSPS